MAQPAALPPGVLSLHVLPADHHDRDWDAIVVPNAVKERLLELNQEIRWVPAPGEGRVEKLVVKPGAAHGWGNMDKDVSTFADWFDQWLKAK